MQPLREPEIIFTAMAVSKVLQHCRAYAWGGIEKPTLAQHGHPRLILGVLAKGEQRGEAGRRRWILDGRCFELRYDLGVGFILMAPGHREISCTNARVRLTAPAPQGDEAKLCVIIT